MFQIADMTFGIIGTGQIYNQSTDSTDGDGCI